MRKNLLAVIAFIFILSSVFVSFGNKVFAVNGNNVFHVTTGNPSLYPAGVDGFISDDSVLIDTGVTPYDDGAQFNITIRIHGDDGNNPIPAHDAQSPGLPNSGVADWADMQNTDWDSIVTSALEESGENGIFLQLGKEKNQIPGGSGDQIDQEVTYEVVGLPANQQPLKSAFGPGYNKARQIEGLIWRIGDAATYFFNKNTFNINPAISGLEPNTTYYARIIIEEDGSDDTWVTGPIISFTTNADVTGGGIIEQNIQPNPPATPPPQSAEGELDFDCGFSNPGGCILTVFYYIFVVASASIAELTGRLFDAFAAISLSSDIYGGSSGIGSFIDNGWSTVRDIANIFFIFILLYTALALVLGLHGVDVKRTISKVIVIALLINFSLFFCHILIDTSNILSRVFYNSMSITSAGNDPVTTIQGIHEQSISAALISGVQPQQILGTDSFQALKNGPGGLTNGMMFVVLLVSFLINLAFAWIFFLCAAFFAGRIGMLWLAMIFAPLAFVTNIVPALDKGLKQLGWATWLSNFLSACFKAPVFFFMMYLIVNLIHGQNGGLVGLITDIMTPGGSWTMTIVGVLLPLLILMGLLLEAKSIAESMAGEFGKAISGIVTAAIGAGAVLATGGVAMAGRGLGSMVKLAGNDAAQKDLRDKMAGRTGLSKLRNIVDGTKLAAATGQVHTFSGKNTGTKIPGGSVFKNLGAAANKAQEKGDHIEHAKHELQDYTTKKFGKDKKFDDLTLSQRGEVSREINRDKESEATYGKKFSALNKAEKDSVDASLRSKVSTADKDEKARELFSKLGIANYAAASPTQQKFIDKKIEESGGGVNSSANKTIRTSKQKMTNMENIAMAARNGTYDARNLANIKGVGFLGGTGAFAVSSLTKAIRAGFNGVGIDLKQSDHTAGTDLKLMFEMMLNGIKKAGVTIPDSGAHAADDHGKKDDHGGGGHH